MSIAFAQHLTEDGLVSTNNLQNKFQVFAGNLSVLNNERQRKDIQHILHP